MKNIFLKEISKLATGLAERGIPYKFRKLWDGYQIIVNGWEWDAICHSGSTGGEDGLMEVAGCMVRDNPDDVDGYLTAEEILKRVDEENYGRK
jgi:hypothetical protein